MNSALEYASQIAYSSKEVLQFTFDSAVKYRDSPGVYCECGVAAGAQIIAMALGAPEKTIYAFDSFQGIPLPSNKDDQMPGIEMLTKAQQAALPDPGKQVLETSGAVSVSVTEFWKNLKTAGVHKHRIFEVQGWFENTVEIFAKYKREIAILRLDGDLYNSTYVCLKHLYPLVIKGGLVIVDDWALPGCREAVYDYFENIKKLPPDMKFIINDESKVAYWTK